MIDIEVGINLEPANRFPGEAFGDERMMSKDFILEGLRGEGFTEVWMVIIDDIDNAHATAQALVDFPSVLYSVAYLPICSRRAPPGSHCTRILKTADRGRTMRLSYPDCICNVPKSFEESTWQLLEVFLLRLCEVC